MKLRVIWLCAILLTAVVVGASQQPPQPAQPAQPALGAPQPALPPQPALGAPSPALPAQLPPGAPQPPPPPRGPDPIGQNLFPPDLVMQNRQAIGLTDEQKAAIKDELMKASARFNELNWQMQDEMETMANLTKGTTVDEQRVLAQLDKILAIEREVKRTQITLSIRIKNKLTAEQQAQLQEMREPKRPPLPR